MTTCENFGIYSHERIRHEMYDGAGPNSQGDAMAGWHQLAGRLTAIRQYVESAISGVQQTQQGAAADAAVGAMVSLGAWVDEAQRLANDTRDRMDNQISEFTMARNSIPEVPPESRGWGWKDIPGIDSFTTSDQEADEAFNAEQERQARAAMIAYQIGTNDRVMHVAQFAPPPAGEPDVAIPTANRSTISGFPGGAGAAPGASTPTAGVGGGAATELTAAPASTWSPGGGAPVAPPGGGGPDPGRPAPVVVPAPIGGVPWTPAAGGPRGPGSGQVNPGRGGPGGAAGMRGGPGVGGFRPPTGGPGFGGFGPDRGGFGPTGSPESAAARAPGAGGAGAGGAGSTGAGGPGAGGQGTAGAAGRAAANAGGVPFGGMGAARGGEDNERRRPSYLIEPDSNRLIGELPWTAPAVIGEDLPDDDEPTRR